MDTYNLFAGSVALTLGILITVMRFLGKLENSPKLISMKARFGERNGNILHILAYSVLPIGIGIYLLYTTLILK